MNKYFEKRLSEVENRLEGCRDASRETSYECMTLMVMLELSKRVDEIDLSMKREFLLLHSKREKYFEEQIALLNMAQILTSGLGKLVGHGKGMINTYGILKLVEAKNYNKAYEIIDDLMKLQDYNPVGDIEKLLDLCKSLDTKDLYNLLINSWLCINSSSKENNKYKPIYMKYILNHSCVY